MATRAKLAATAASLLIANVAEPSSRCRHSHFRRLQPRTMAHACLAHCVISAIETRTGARFGGACKATKHRMGEGPGCPNTGADLWGTEGSNPSLSREESSANLSFPAPSRRLQVQRNAHAENARIVDADCVVTTENR
jgi:hypothetical protein